MATARRWRWMALIFIPVASGICWAALPWTFGDGARALIGFVGYSTLILSVGGRFDAGFLGYLGIGFVPRVIDVFLFVGVVSWLILASRSTDSEPSRPTQAESRS